MKIFLALALACSASLQAQSIPEEAPIAPAVTAFEAALVGRWSGVLEYRDYQTNGRTKLPTWSSISLSHTGLTWQYTYDDGPNKQVVENLAVTVTPASYKVVNTDKPADATTSSVAGLDALKNGRGTLVLTGTIQENNHPVEARTTLTLRRNLLEIVKETRAAGEEFKFRDGYTLTRLTPLYEAPPAAH
ncbi:hypothetical protein [Granulicella tundricola]|uniref:THAP4-like heme-binding beta-barrel domain-containing protein n=1 Tax=Granulicella tundricola (strain ATCC BAA-1859 / DSM 23138 / MP5ACTX9) TaxID=1198114 RepID=E8WVW1_GRATM|nr:hypothetical protein [Granulicella tundricola]ADW70720.1 hypothetical protein AciX9_3719 [Granulicella tundricola MP5ACTX9]